MQPNLLQHYYMQARDWYAEVQQTIQQEIDTYDKVLAGMPDEFHLNELIIQDTHLKEHYHREQYTQYLYHAKRNLLAWTIQVHQDIEIETDHFEPETEALFQSVMNDSIYRVCWTEMCDKVLQFMYPTIVAFPDQELMEARVAVMALREPENTTRKVQAVAIELVQAESSSTEDLERRLLVRSGYNVRALLASGSLHTNYKEWYESSDDLWIRANDLILLWTKGVSNYDKVDFAVLFDDNSSFPGMIDVGPKWKEQTLLHDHILHYCGFYTGRRQPQRMHKEKYHSFIACAQDKLASYKHILDECQVGPEGV